MVCVFPQWRTSFCFCHWGRPVKALAGQFLGPRPGAGRQLPALGRDEGQLASAWQTEGGETAAINPVTCDCPPVRLWRSQPHAHGPLGPQAALLTFLEAPQQRVGSERVGEGFWAPLLSTAGSLTSLSVIPCHAASMLLSELTPAWAAGRGRTWIGQN